MTVVHQRLSGGGADTPVELDVCRGCQVVWFDAGEDTAVAGPLPDKAPDPLAHLPESDRLEMKKAEARLTMESTRHQDGYHDEPTGYTGLQQLGAVFGIPIEDGAPPRTVVPFITWGLSAMMLLGSIYAVSNLDHTYSALGLLSEDPLRGGGLPVLVGALTDPRPVCALFNLVVLWRFGDNVENLLGATGYVLLLGVALGAGWIVHTVGFGSPGQPMLGMTAAVSAVAVLYSLRFPWVRLGWYQYYQRGFFENRGGLWWSMPVRWAVLAFVVLATVLPWQGAAPDAPNSWVEAIVGAAVGVGAWLLFGQGVMRHPDRSE